MISASFCDTKPCLITKLFQTLDWCYDVKLIWSKSMSINDIFVGQQVCKQAHTHANLYHTRATVLHLFKAQTDFLSHCTALTKPVPDCRRSSSFSNKFLLNFMSAFRHVTPYGRTQKCQKLGFIVIITGRLYHKR